MYGMVNRAIEDLIVSSAGTDTWEQIKLKAGLENLQFLDSSNYEDDITYKLVAAASVVLDQPPYDVLHAFGRHWVLYTGREGWASLFNVAGSDFISFLEQLDEMHARVSTAMPEGKMPEFTLIRKDGNFDLEYRSEREGLAPMVVGILSGLAEQFNEAWEIEHIGHRSESGLDRFQLTSVPNVGLDERSDAA